MNSAFRRNACPTLAVPMRTGDGLLARLPPLTRSMTPPVLAGLARAASVFGNGTIEVSARGNVQIRGLRDDGADGLTAAMTALGLAGTDGLPITVNPLADIEGERDRLGKLLVALSDLAAEIDRRLFVSGLGPMLPPKTTIILDGGTLFPLDRLAADLRFRIDGGLAHIGLGGIERDAVWLGSVPVDSVAEAALRCLKVIAARGRDQRFETTLEESGTTPFAAELGHLLRPSPIPAARPAMASVGWLREGPDFAVIGLGLPFGQVAAGTLIELAIAAESASAVAIAPAPGRSLLVGGQPDGMRDLRTRAAVLGFLTECNDPRLSISACIGSDGCRSGHMPARRLAAQIAAASPGLFDGSISVHLSGCAKGCAHPGEASLTLVGSEQGCGLVIHGRSQDLPRGFVAAESLPAGFARLARDAGRPAETGAALLERMGADAVETSLLGQNPMAEGPDYLRDGHAIYERSFAIIRAEADLTRFSTEEAHVAVRMIHASGLVPLAEVIRFGHDFAGVARRALLAGAPILCDAEMVERGVTRARLPADNPVICTLRDPAVPALAARLATTRSAAAVDLWGDRLDGALVVIGNAPTALFHLLERLRAGALPRPAAIIGVPVGFIGAAESKAALAAHPLAIPYVVVEGRLGGSAIAAAAVNALASDAL